MTLFTQKGKNLQEQIKETKLPKDTKFYSPVAKQLQNMIRGNVTPPSFVPVQVKFNTSVKL